MVSSLSPREERTGREPERGEFNFYGIDDCTGEIRENLLSPLSSGFARKRGDEHQF
jgi:hypothetical protein